MLEGGWWRYGQSCGESSEEELSVLPRHTKVVVTGNNRTKSVLVGLQGVVKKAVGLGGGIGCGLFISNNVIALFVMLNNVIIKLVLTNGIEVKLQRNALSVIEAPTGHEEDDEFECENMPWNASDMASDDTQSQKPLRSRSRTHKVSAHKSLSRSHSCDSQSKGSISSSTGTMVWRNKKNQKGHE
ncbi:hypothetical protein J5N97_010433 [Dioscorea zingiberensis]|uniref:Uncharacterized protein n=1 Tax=Dioscorea zingiberensis TaxID=325984 RepID=A0A9D5D165_9LILI|nr:hypothetical protein J5N97_010433 [Dioscorea zingiberensis]